MGPPDSKRRLFRLLRRGSRAAGAPTRSPAEEGALWAAHERAGTSVRDTGEAAQRIVSHIAKQRGTVDALADRARAVSARATDLGATFNRLVDSFGRLELVALNAGLEAARIGEGGGLALGRVADEVRAQASRGSEASRELGAALSEIGAELTQVNTSLDRARDAASEVAQEASRASASAADAERALAAIREKLEKTMGSDPEVARAIAEASEHARALVEALARTTGKVPHAVLATALRPVLEPLERLLEGDDGG